MRKLNPIIAWTFIVFGIILILAGINQCYIDLVELPSGHLTFISPLVFGVVFSAVGDRMRRKNSW